MKRKHVSYPNVVCGDIYNHYGLIVWQKCWFCGEDFRREKGYRFQIQYNRPWVYSCASCCDSKQNVNDNIKKWFKENRPKAPAAPPKGR